MCVVSFAAQRVARDFLFSLLLRGWLENGLKQSQTTTGVTYVAGCVARLVWKMTPKRLLGGGDGFGFDKRGAIRQRIDEATEGLLVTHQHIGAADGGGDRLGVFAASGLFVIHQHFDRFVD